MVKFLVVSKKKKKKKEKNKNKFLKKMEKVGLKIFCLQPFLELALTTKRT